MKSNDSDSSRRMVRISRLLFVAYVLCVIYFMFFAEGFGRTSENPGYRYNFDPFTEIKRFSHMLNSGYSLKALLNLFGNIIAFIPFGIFLPVLSNNRIKFVNTVILTYIFSIVIETVQLYFQLGVFDVDDLILNTCGGLIGYLIYAIGKAWSTE